MTDTFQLKTGTAAERRVVRLALRDLSAVWGRHLCARTRGPRCRRIVIGDEHFHPTDDHESIGFLLERPRSRIIALRPGLSDSELYAITLHELGHFFGLGHSPTGLMSPFPSLRMWGRLTLSLRQRLVRDLVHRLTNAAIKQIAA